MIGIIMGSQSDMEIMKEAAEVLDKLGVAYDLAVASAHRNPEKVSAFARNAAGKYKCIIAGAGKAAHLPGVIAGQTTLPVIGVPIKTSDLGGLDSLLSIVQMPQGVPVATVAINGARNAGILAAQICALSDAKIAKAVSAYKEALKG
ncbi:5-(carboxyamino)imidazole ribonucleotide mutase [Candidatus Termititenax persephonae]|uniref:N5-carboxyaminoimidazole ribonucleotide mutase n=1 Tax=Candidatus Termititenax persephonae TaxID=2218525 RepID=A0A388TGR7_9BACT|nr:5-(carboxyamino)imidazole ribonucleotide mutase [Candidatus Termititenax persephonae]